MPSAMSTESVDMASGASSFSYAQAAKGRSPSRSAAVDASKPASEETDSSSRTENTNGHAAAESLQSPDEQHRPRAESSLTTEETERTTESISTQATTMPQANGEHENGLKELSIPNVAGSDKEEDSITITTNLDGGDGKTLQESPADEKDTLNQDADSESAQTEPIEELPAQPQLKEAPPPAFNIWQKRAADAQNKAKESGQGQPENGLVSGPKSAPSHQESTKVEYKRRPSGRRNPTDERNTVMTESVEEDKTATRAVKLSGPAKSLTAPPPRSDATSWPTFDLAKEEERKKNQERTEKTERTEPEKPSSKSHGKEKWVQMPYVPSAVFNTPLPTTSRRGGRPRGGGREGGGRGGHTANGTAGNERTTSGSVSHSANQGERVRGEMGPPKPGTFLPKPKRASSAGPSGSRETRRHGEGFQDEANPKSFHRGTAAESRRVSSSAQTDSGIRHSSIQTEDGIRQNSPPNRRYDGGREERSQSAFSSRREGGNRQDFSRDGSIASTRERGEGRPERGRGGYRGRGGHNGYVPHSVNGQNTQQNFSSGGPFSNKTASFTESRYSAQTHTSSFGPQREPKHFRSNSRSQSIPNPSNFGRYPTNGSAAGPQGLPHLQTDTANMYYAQPTIMSAVPFNVMEQVQLSSMIQLQMEYYFSLDNLVRDTFLRKQMDSQGFVPLSVLVNFNRIKQLSTDIELVRAACWRSPQIEFLTGSDGHDRVRVSRDWQQWVLPMQERDVAAQNDGPSQIFSPTLPYGPHGVPAPAGAISPAHFTTPSYRQEQGLANGTPSGPPPANDGNNTSTPLSAAVPDFTPMTSTVSLAGSPAASIVPPENVFHDDQVDGLTIVHTKELNDRNSTKAPALAGRTFSNGSIDAASVSEEFSNLGLAGHPTTTNGDHAPESRSQGALARSRSPLSPNDASRNLSGTAAPPVFWAKDNDSTLKDLPSSLIAESYSVFHRNVLSKREELSLEQIAHDMIVLYQFWSHFLIRNFNLKMYEEFKTLAFEDDLLQNSMVGLEHLTTYYDASILGKELVSDLVTYDYVQFARHDLESGRKERPAFQKLRASWRNGALPLKNRVKIDKLLEPKMKSELDR